VQIPPFGWFSLPFAVTPSAITASSVRVTIRAALRVSAAPRQLQQQLPATLDFDFPLVCVGEAPVGDRPVVVHCVARTRSSTSAVLPLPGLSLAAAATRPTSPSQQQQQLSDAIASAVASEFDGVTSGGAISGASFTVELQAVSVTVPQPPPSLTAVMHGLNHQHASNDPLVALAKTASAAPAGFLQVLCQCKT
jgi:hypothetical protein